MQNKNTALNIAKFSPNTDEWYTPYEAIADEVDHYRSQFSGKVVLCNCNDIFGSNFCCYFLRHFNRLRLKKLICVSFAGSEIDQFCGRVLRSDEIRDKSGAPVDLRKGYVLEVTEMPGEAGKEVSDELIEEWIKSKCEVSSLNGSGDFRDAECVEYIKECDICCTNPPFSLFSELFELLTNNHKHFLLVGNQNAITYKEIFPHIKANLVRVGYCFGDMAFRVPADTVPRDTRFWIDSSGQKWRSLGNVMWLTNLDISDRRPALVLTKVYSPELYPRYDNFDGIHIQKLADIPLDYEGVMGVPITYMKYHNPQQFEIVGLANNPISDGRRLYKRILIRRLKEEGREE